jgi:hypothetical protein
MSTELTPYVILEAHPDYKHPYILPEFGMIEEHKLKEFILNKLVEFIYDKNHIINVKTIKDIEDFWNHYYDKCYMANKPWEATAIIDGIWENVTPSNESVFSVLVKRKQIDYISSDDESKRNVVYRNNELNDNVSDLSDDSSEDFENMLIYDLDDDLSG